MDITKLWNHKILYALLRERKKRFGINPPFYFRPERISLCDSNVYDLRLINNNKKG